MKKLILLAMTIATTQALTLIWDIPAGATLADQTNLVLVGTMQGTNFVTVPSTVIIPASIKGFWIYSGLEVTNLTRAMAVPATATSVVVQAASPQMFFSVTITNINGESVPSNAVRIPDTNGTVKLGLTR